MKIGIFTASTPIGALFPMRAKRAIAFLEANGHEVILGNLFFKRNFYVAADPKERANEINELVKKDVDLLLSAIGGSNTSSILPFLDFNLINDKKPIFCGFSDTTSLLSAVLVKARNCRVIYGPALFPNFGEFEKGSSTFSSLALEEVITNKTYRVKKPPFFYTSFQNWENYEEERTTSSNEWKIMNLNPKITRFEGILFGGNGSTLMGIMGSEYVFKPKQPRILLLEDEQKTAAELERIYTSLVLNKMFTDVECIIFGKGKVTDFKELRPVDLLDKILKANKINLPILYDVDISHFKPMSAIELNRWTTVLFDEKRIIQTSH